MYASRNQLLLTALGWIMRPTLESVVQVFR
jgi:hypothetical protein